ncbi:lipid II:glycine glycyltransferase FemX [Nanoarchaeota archaeon]
MTEYKIGILTEEDYDSYNKFLHSNEDALIDHTLEFKEIISNNFNYEAIYLTAKKEEEIVGILPLFKAKSFLSGTRLISLPYSITGGLICKEKECAKELIEAAKKLVKDKIKYLEIRQRKPLDSELLTDFTIQNNVVSFYLNLDKPISVIWKQLPKSSIRWGIKKAKKSNLTIRVGNNKEILNHFYDLYLNTRKDRGIPAYSYSFFKDLIDKLGEGVRISVAFHGKEPLASIFLLCYNGEIRYNFAGASYKNEHRQFQPYHILLWDAIQHGVNNNYKRFNFHASIIDQDGGGLYKFKQRWSEEEKELNYYFYPKNDKLTDSDLNNSYGFIRKILKKLPKKVIAKISPLAIKQYA